jgi:hypothetical protein
MPLLVQAGIFVYRARIATRGKGRDESVIRKGISRVLRWVFAGARDRLIEDQIRKNAEALEMKRQGADSLPA